MNKTVKWYTKEEEQLIAERIKDYRRVPLHIKKELADKLGRSVDSIVQKIHYLRLPNYTTRSANKWTQKEIELVKFMLNNRSKNHTNKDLAEKLESIVDHSYNSILFKLSELSNTQGLRRKFRYTPEDKKMIASEVEKMEGQTIKDVAIKLAEKTNHTVNSIAWYISKYHPVRKK